MGVPHICARGVSVAGIMAFVLLTGPARSSPQFNLANTAWSEAAHRHGLDPYLVYAVALAETRRAGRSGVTPSLFAINDNGGRSHFFATRSEAVAFLRAHPEPGRLDLGPLQVNVRWNGHRVADPVQLLDPRTNLDAGAAALGEAIRSAPGDLVTGIGRYHSRRPERFQPYAARVIRYWRALRAEAGLPPADAALASPRLDDASLGALFAQPRTQTQAVAAVRTVRARRPSLLSGG